MDFIELFRDSPIWLQVYLVTIQLGALIPVFKVIVFIFKWLKHMVLDMYKWLDIEGRYYWLRYKPQVLLITKPTILISDIADGRKKWALQISIKFIGNDSKGTDFNITDLQALVWQGCCKRKSRVILKSMLSAYSDNQFKLNKEEIEKNITLESYVSVNIPESNIDLNKPFKWRLNGIIAKLFGAHSRHLPSFKGCKDDVQVSEVTSPNNS